MRPVYMTRAIKTDLDVKENETTGKTLFSHENPLPESSITHIFKENDPVSNN